MIPIKWYIDSVSNWIIKRGWKLHTRYPSLPIKIQKKYRKEETGRGFRALQKTNVTPGQTSPLIERADLTNEPERRAAMLRRDQKETVR